MAADSVSAAKWQRLLDAIPEDKLSRAEKHAVQARILLLEATPEERFGLFRGGHEDAAERLRALLQLSGSNVGEGGVKQLSGQIAETVLSGLKAFIISTVDTIETDDLPDGHKSDKSDGEKLMEGLRRIFDA